jgi:RNA polymerase primary sigma factor
MVASSQSDAIQLYLTQMSDSPLLSRQEEFNAAMRIERARKRLRRAMLTSDYVLQAAVGMLEKVARGRMRLETVCEGPYTDPRRKTRLVAFIAANQKTLHVLMEQNRTDFSAALSKKLPREHRRQLRRRMFLRRLKAIRLVEESPVRRQHLQLVFQRLQEYRARWTVRFASCPIREFARIVLGGRKSEENCSV